MEVLAQLPLPSPSGQDDKESWCSSNRGTPPVSVQLKQSRFPGPGVRTGSQGSMGPPGLSFGQKETQSFRPTVKDLYPPKIFPHNVVCTVGAL